MSILGPMLGRPWLRRRNARLLRDAGRAINEAGYICAGGIDHFVTIRSARTSPLHTMADIREVNAGMTESMRQLYPELAAFDARAVATEFRIPFFVFQGAADNVTPTECARVFTETVRAPVTEFATIAGTGHLAAFTRPDEFLRLLVERVLPVVSGTPD